MNELPQQPADNGHTSDGTNGPESRIDGPHGLKRAGSSSQSQAVPADAVLAAMAEGLRVLDGGEQDGPALTAEALERHASELSERLQEQLEQVDRRQAHLSSQEAEFEGRMRNARLWLEQRQSEIEQQEETLRRQAEALEAERQSLCEQQAEAAGGELSEEYHLRIDQLAERELELQVAETEVQEKQRELELKTALCGEKLEELEEKTAELESRQRGLDQREAELYTLQETSTTEQVALKQRQEAFENAQQELNKRQAELKAWEQKLGERSGEIEWRSAELARKEQQVEQQEGELEEKAQRLEFRQREIELALERFNRLGVTEQKMDELRRHGAELIARRQCLEAAEMLLADQQAQLEEARRELQHQQLQFEAHVVRERQNVEDSRREAKREQDDRALQLEAREAELRQREDAAERLREELRAAQRDVLETRLAVEETWMRLQGVLAPATLTSSVAQLKTRLADHFRLVADELATRRQDLENVRAELAEQHEQLEASRVELTGWLQRRQREHEEEAERLVAREKELNRLQQEHRAEQAKWQAERASYHREIQKLLAERHAAEAWAA